MKKRTVMFLWLVIIMFILILIPYIQNAGNGPGSATGVYFFMGYSQYVSSVYLYIISMGMIEGALITIFIQSLLNDIKEPEPTKFDLNSQ
ncbi:MAG: hypothetical protein WC875_02455 [Candidatus Absconditabacterales bacterium]